MGMVVMVLLLQLHWLLQGQVSQLVFGTIKHRLEPWRVEFTLHLFDKPEVLSNMKLPLLNMMPGSITADHRGQLHIVGMRSAHVARPAVSSACQCLPADT